LNIERIAVDDSSHYSQKNSIKRTLVLITQYPGSSRTPGRIFAKGSLCENREALLRKINACDLFSKMIPLRKPFFD
jgi:hypothetical protein